MSRIPDRRAVASSVALVISAAVAVCQDAGVKPASDPVVRLTDDDWRVRNAAARELATGDGARPNRVVAALRDAAGGARDPEVFWLGGAFSAGPSRPEDLLDLGGGLRFAGGDPVFEVPRPTRPEDLVVPFSARTLAAFVLGYRGAARSTDGVFDALVDVLAATDGEVLRSTCVHALRDVRQRAIAELEGRLVAAPSDVRVAAALDSFGPDGRATLLELLSGSDRGRLDAASAWVHRLRHEDLAGDLDVVDKAVERALHAEDRAVRVRYCALVVYGHDPRVDRRALSALGPVLEGSEDAEVLSRAVGMVALLPERAEGLVPRLVKLGAHRDARVSAWSVDALARIGRHTALPDFALDLIVTRLQHENDGSARRGLARAIQRLGRHGDQPQRIARRLVAVATEPGLRASTLADAFSEAEWRAAATDAVAADLVAVLEAERDFGRLFAARMLAAVELDGDLARRAVRAVERCIDHAAIPKEQIVMLSVLGATGEAARGRGIELLGWGLASLDAPMVRASAHAAERLGPRAAALAGDLRAIWESRVGLAGDRDVLSAWLATDARPLLELAAITGAEALSRRGRGTARRSSSSSRSPACSTESPASVA